MQKYAEEALAEHLSKEVQPDFYRRADISKILLIPTMIKKRG
jgi:hypothetical protein